MITWIATLIYAVANTISRLDLAVRVIHSAFSMVTQSQGIVVGWYGNNHPRYCACTTASHLCAHFHHTVHLSVLMI
jgi:hypothetical protein